MKDNPSRKIREMQILGGVFTTELFIFICDQALQCEFFLSDHVCLRTNTTKSVSLSQRQVLCILSHAFLDTLPDESTHNFLGQRLTFRQFFEKDRSARPHIMDAKLNCILFYFDSCKKRVDDDRGWEGTNISFTRGAISSLSGIDDWSSSSNVLSSFIVQDVGGIDDCTIALQGEDFSIEFQ